MLEKVEVVKIPEVINNILNTICDSLENCVEKDSEVPPRISGLVVNPKTQSMAVSPDQVSRRM